MLILKLMFIGFFMFFCGLVLRAVCAQAWTEGFQACLEQRRLQGGG